MSEQAKWPEAWVVYNVYGEPLISHYPGVEPTRRRVALIPVEEAERMAREVEEAKRGESGCLATREILKRQRNEALDKLKAAERERDEARADGRELAAFNQRHVSAREAAESEAAALRERVAELEREKERLEGIVEPFAGTDIGWRERPETWITFYRVSSSSLQGTAERLRAEASRIRARRAAPAAAGGEGEVELTEEEKGSLRFCAELDGAATGLMQQASLERRGLVERHQRDGKSYWRLAPAGLAYARRKGWPPPEPEPSVEDRLAAVERRVERLEEGR